MNVSRFFEKWIKIFLYVYVFQDYVLAYVYVYPACSYFVSKKAYHIKSATLFLYMIT